MNARIEERQAVGAPGHEGWDGAIADNVEDVAFGDNVALLSQHACARLEFAPASMVARIADCVGGRPLPGGPPACVMDILRRSDIRAGQWPAVIGIGFMGALLVQGAARARDKARHCGAAHPLDGAARGAAHPRAFELMRERPDGFMQAVVAA